MPGLRRAEGSQMVERQGRVRSGRAGRPAWVLAAVAVTVFALLAVSCSSDDDDTSAEGSGSSSTVAEAPKDGGVLVFAQWSELKSLDPFTLGAYGSTGGIEMGALYDRLVEWDPV